MLIKLFLLPFYPIKMHQPDCYCNWLWRMHCTGSNIKDSWLKALCTAPENFQRNATSHLQNVLLTKHIWPFNGARFLMGTFSHHGSPLLDFPLHCVNWHGHYQGFPSSLQVWKISFIRPVTSFANAIQGWIMWTWRWNSIPWNWEVGFNLLHFVDQVQHTCVTDNLNLIGTLVGYMCAYLWISDLEPVLCIQSRSSSKMLTHITRELHSFFMCHIFK